MKEPNKKGHRSWNTHLFFLVLLISIGSHFFCTSTWKKWCFTLTRIKSNYAIVVFHKWFDHKFVPHFTNDKYHTIFNVKQRGKTIPILEFVDLLHHLCTNRKILQKISFGKRNGNSFEFIDEFNESIKEMFKWRIICWTLLLASKERFYCDRRSNVSNISHFRLLFNSSSWNPFVVWSVHRRWKDKGLIASNHWILWTILLNRIHRPFLQRRLISHHWTLFESWTQDHIFLFMLQPRIFVCIEKIHSCHINHAPFTSSFKWD